MISIHFFRMMVGILLIPVNPLFLLCLMEFGLGKIEPVSLVEKTGRVKLVIWDSRKAIDFRFQNFSHACAV